MSDSTEIDLDYILDAGAAKLQEVPGLLVQRGMAWEVPSVPMAYIMYEGESTEAAAIEVPALRFQVRLLLAWVDRSEESERELYRLLKRIRPLLLAQDAFAGTEVAINPNTLRVDASERGDGMTEIRGKPYRSAAIRFEVKA